MAAARRGRAQAADHEGVPRAPQGEEGFLLKRREAGGFQWKIPLASEAQAGGGVGCGAAGMRVRFGKSRVAGQEERWTTKTFVPSASDAVPWEQGREAQTCHPAWHLPQL